MTSAGWLRIRMAFVAIAFLSGLVQSGTITAGLIASLHGEMRSSAWLLAVLMLVTVAIFPVGFMLLMAFLIRIFDPRSDVTRANLSHDSNPLDRNLFQFFHFGAFLGIANGAGIVISSIWNGLPGLVLGIPITIFGISLLAGIHLSKLLFKNRIDSPPA